MFDDWFRSQSKTKTMNLRFQLQTLKKGNSSIDEFVLQVRNIADALHAAGQTLSDDKVVMHLLGGLGSEFESVVVNLTTRPPLPSFTEVHSILQTHEMRLFQASASAQLVSTHGNSVNPTTNVAFKENKSNSGGKQKGKQKFYNKSKVFCQICGKNNHTALKCYKRFDHQYQGPENNQSSGNNASGSQSSNGYQAHFSQASTSYSSPNPMSFTSNDSCDTSSQHATGSEWFVDSGATHHITSALGNMQLQTPYKGTSKLVVGNGTTAPILNVGSMNIPSLQHDRSITLSEVLHVPDITKNLISISKFLRDNDAIIEFHAASCLVKNRKTHKILLRGVLKDGLYQLEVGTLGSSLLSPTSTQSCYAVSSSSSNKTDLWHLRLGHPCYDTLCTVLRHLKISVGSNTFCDACKLGKMHQ